MARHDDEDVCVTVHLPYDDSSVRRARHLLGEDLRGAGLRTTVVEDAELVVSELLTNGLLHGQPHPDRTIRLSWCLSRDHLRLSVIDGGNVEDLKPVHLTDTRLSGRGLAIVDYVCANWRVEQADGTRVTAELAYA